MASRNSENRSRKSGKLELSELGCGYVLHAKPRVPEVIGRGRGECANGGPHGSHSLT